jgi:hypothetical protein
MNGSILSYSLKFSVYTVLAFAVVAAGLYLINQYAPGLLQGGMDSGAMIGALVGLVMVPVLSVAKAFHASEGRHVTGTEGIVMSVIFALSTLLIVAVATVIMNQLMTGSLVGYGNLDDLTADPAALGILVGGAFVTLVLVYRLFLWAGIRGEMVRASRR